MSSTEPPLTRTGSSAPGSRSRTAATADSGLRSRAVDETVRAVPEGRLVRAVAWSAGALRETRIAITRAAAWTVRSIRPAGALVATAATIGFAAGIVFGWMEWIMGGAVCLMLLAMSVPFLFGARSYEVDLSLTHSRIVAGADVAGEIVVRNDGARVALPGRIDIPVGDGLVEFGVPLLRPGHAVAQPLEIPDLHRGIVTIGPATTVRSDPVGLLRREHAFDDVHDLYVHPRTVSIPSTSAGLIRDLEGSPTRRLVDADMSFHAIREYAPGDSRRQIHWKSTAKTGQLMVRQYEESRRSRMAVILAIAATEYADADEFELAVSCAASLGVRAVQDARDLDIVTGSPIPRVVRGRRRAVRHIPVVSPRAMLDGFSGIDLLDETMAVGDVCRLAAEANERLSIAVVVAGSRVPLVALRQAALAFPADTAVVAVVCDERAHPRVRPLAGLSVLTVGTLDDLAGLLLRGATG